MRGEVDPPPWHLDAGGGLRAVVVDGGALASLATEDLELVQHAASPFEPGLVQLWLRDRGSGTCLPLLGAGSGSAVAVHDGALVVTGAADGLRWRATLTLHPRRTAWVWQVQVDHDGPGPREVDVVHGHDVALAAPGALRTNELYVSQYLDLSPLTGPTGTALAVRQNLPQGGRHPWCVLVADGPVAGWATDALDVHGLGGRSGPVTVARDLPSRRRQHEHTLATLQTASRALAPGETLRVRFVGLLLDDHPAATGQDDLALVEESLALAEDLPEDAARPGDTPARHTSPRGRLAPSGVYDRGRELPCRALDADELAVRWPGPWQVVEQDADGSVLSFFAGDAHVVTRTKELAVLRPHGTVLRSGDRAAPDPEGLTATAWMAGSPLSYLTRGHVTNGRVLTTVRGYLGQHRAYGLRLLVEVAGRWRLLDLPSAFAMTPDSATWVHMIAPEPGDPGGVVEVRTRIPASEHRAELRVDVVGPTRRLLVALHLSTPAEPLPAGVGATAVTGEDGDVAVQVEWPDAARRTLTVHPSARLAAGDDRHLFDDATPRDPGVVTLRSAEVGSLTLDLRVGPDSGERTEATPERGSGAGEQWWPQVTALSVSGEGEEVAGLAVSLPWLVRDALVHHLSPRGLEQYNGGAWGTRDVAQGPLELLLALDRPADARALLISIFGAQSPDGSWPQAFGFLPGDDLRHRPAHGDVVHWPVLALGRYLLAWADPEIMALAVGWADPDLPATPLADHVDRALEHARAGFLPGTHLVAYGHGDWNDSLQPADPEMARTMTSTWTVTLHHQALSTLAAGLAAVAGRDDASAWSQVEALRAQAAAVAVDLHRYLLVDDELVGYARLATDDRGQVCVVQHLVHPRDTETGLHHGSLQMIHALGADLLDADQAAHHVALVAEHLTGVDGVRLFDRPPGYHGGETRHFQRAETATFVGREIGLMYVHAHLRWCEAMAHWGDAEALWLGLRQALAAAAPDVVPGAARRQANTYASSSDAAVADRAEFAARYPQVLTGETGLEGGWRLYSSGPGVLVRTVTQSLLGVRRRGDRVEIDPVLPRSLDGLRASVPMAGGLLRLRLLVGTQGSGVEALTLAGRELSGQPTLNPYRAAGPSLALADLADALRPGGPELEVVVR